MRAAIYCRRSIKVDPLDQTNSLEVQRADCERYCQGKKWDIIPEHYDDAGISGATERRPAYQRLIADCKAGKIDVVVVYRYDRLSRSLVHFSKVLMGLDRRGIMLVSTSQNIDTSTPTGRLMVNIIASFAQYERETISERIKSYNAHRKAIGGISNSVPYGFKRESSMRAVVDPPALDVIIRCYREKIKGATFDEICEDLNADGIRTPNGFLWKKETVCDKMHNALEFCRTRPELADVYATYFSEVHIVRRGGVRKRKLVRVDDTDL